jgi:hypothetical protein
MAGAVRIAFEAPVARTAWVLFCETNGFVHAFRMKGGGDVFRKGGVQVAAWEEETPDGTPDGAAPAPADAVGGAIVQAFGTSDPAEAAAAARTVLRAFPASLEAHAEPRVPTPREERTEPRVPTPQEVRAAPLAPVRPRPLSRPRPPAAAFAAVPTTASEAVALLDGDERAALRWLPADGSARDRRGGASPAGSAGAAPERRSAWTDGAGPSGVVLERLSDWTVGDPRRVVSARLCLCVREREGEAPPGAGEFWRLTPLGAAVRGVLQATAAAVSADGDAEAP